MLWSDGHCGCLCLNAQCRACTRADCNLCDVAGLVAALLHDVSTSCITHNNLAGPPATDTCQTSQTLKNEARPRSHRWHRRRLRRALVGAGRQDAAAAAPVRSGRAPRLRSASSTRWDSRRMSTRAARVHREARSSTAACAAASVSPLIAIPGRDTPRPPHTINAPPRRPCSRPSDFSSRSTARSRALTPRPTCRSSNRPAGGLCWASP